MRPLSRYQWWMDPNPQTNRHFTRVGSDLTCKGCPGANTNLFALTVNDEETDFELSNLLSMF
jgi:hypothetical protein